MRKIGWEKWRDDEHYVETSRELTEGVEDMEVEEVDLTNGPDIGVTIYPHIVRTPLGDYSVLDHGLPSKNFDCWIGHFNFPITESVFNILNNQVEGIEVLRVMSKYRIFIGVGKMFKFREVRARIDELFSSETSKIEKE